MSVESVITENLDIWTSAIKTKSASGRGSSNKLELYGIKKLRELIFELAIRGKLVSPEVTDIPVNDLLHTIEKEKAQLVKSKEIKKPKKLPAIQNDEVPFDVPEGWQWVRLGVLGNIFNGNSVNAKLKEEKYTGLAQGLPFIATKDVGYGFEQLDYDNGVLIPSGEPKFKVAKAGAVLVCAEGGSAGKKCGITNKDICFGNKLFANQLYGNISPRYILSCYLSPTFYKMFSESMTGIIGGISAAKFSELMIPLPPLSYQNRLVSKIDDLMLLCDQLESETESSIKAHKTLVETLLATLTNAKDADELNESWQRISEHFDTLFTTEDSIDQLKQTILQLAVMGKLIPWKRNVQTSELKKFLSFGPRNGFSPKESPIATEYKVLKLGATSYGSLDLTETKYIDLDVTASSHLWLKAGDILIQRGNSANFVGSNVLIYSDVEKTIYPDLMMKIRTNEALLPEYLSLWLSSPQTRNYMWERMTGTSGTMPKISKKVVESIPIHVPELSTQRIVVSKVNQLMALCAQLKQKLGTFNGTQRVYSDIVGENILSS